MQSVIDIVVQWATALIGQWGLPAVFVLMLLESACIPIPSEATMLFAGFAVSTGDMSLLGITVAGVAGNVVGSWAAYAVGLYGGRPFIDKYGKYIFLRHHHVELAERWFARYGPATVFFSRLLPIVRTFISFPAGVARMPLGKFVLYSTLGALPWSILLAYAGVILGENWVDIRHALQPFDLAIAIAVVLAVLVFLAWRLGLPGRIRRRLS